MRSGTVSARPRSGHPTFASASSSWPTAQAHDSRTIPWAKKPRWGLLSDAILAWPTPRSAGFEEDPEVYRSRREKNRPGSRAAGRVGVAVRLWPTPDASAFNDGEPPESFLARQERHRERGEDISPTLAMFAKLWSTPTDDTKRGGPALAETRLAQGHT